MPMPFYKIANVSCERFIITNLWPKQIELKKYLLFLDFFHTQDCAVGLSYLCLSFSLPHQKGVGQRTSTCLFLSLWTTSSSMKTNCVADRRNSEFWQRIGQPYARQLGRCFVAVVEIETDRCAVCLAELDAVQSEADRQADVRWARAGNKQSPDILSLPICVSLFAANMDVSRSNRAW